LTHRIVLYYVGRARLGRIPNCTSTKEGSLLQSRLWGTALRVYFLAGLAIFAMPRVGISQTYTFVDMYKISPGLGYNIPVFADTYVATGGWIGAAATKVNPPPGEGPNHAMYWSPSGVPTDVHPSGYTLSQLNAISPNGQKVGTVSVPGGLTRAAMWDASNTFVDLNPDGYYSSQAHGTDGQSQVGYARSTTAASPHATVWHGTNAGTDLNPDGFTSSFAFGVSGNQQVGYGTGTASGNLIHALLWNGTNAAIDLNPVGSLTSRAWATDGSQQVGYGSSVAGDGINTRHALLWNGSNDAIDLNPAGIATSQALGVFNGKQLGFAGATYLTAHAMLWSGTNVPIDLGALAPNTFQLTQAYNMDAAGNVYGYGMDTNMDYHVLKWVAVPEPAALMLLASAASAGLLRRKR
jgi:hypothetical protein